MYNPVMWLIVIVVGMLLMDKSVREKAWSALAIVAAIGSFVGFAVFVVAMLALIIKHLNN